MIARCAVLSLADSRVTVSIKSLRLAVAICDDLSAIIITTLFYTADLSQTALMMAIIPATGLFPLNRRGVTAWAI